jgi:hypothetical protein
VRPRHRNSSRRPHAPRLDRTATLVLSDFRPPELHTASTTDGDTSLPRSEGI